MDTPRQEWEKRHQVFEMDFHCKHNYRWDDNWWFTYWDKVFDEFACMQKNSLQGLACADIGCGSRPALDQWFEAWTTPGNKPECIWKQDPLLEKYRKIPEVAKHWEKLHDISSAPAEVMMDSLEGLLDFVLCWNALDHCFDPMKVMDNITKYLKPGGILLLSYDLAEAHLGHPGIPNRKELSQFIMKHYTVEAFAFREYNRDVCLKLRRRS